MDTNSVYNQPSAVRVWMPYSADDDETEVAYRQPAEVGAVG
jgi:hypothetical protein